MANLATLYQGALLGQALSKQLGESSAVGEDIGQEVRANLLQTAVASGKLNPASLTGTDAALLGSGITKTPIPHQGGGFLNDVLGAVATPFKVAINTAGDFAHALEGIPQGIATIGEAAYNTLNPVGNAVNSAFGIQQYKTPRGPNLADVGKQIAQSTVHDFTNFDPMHPLYPALDVASVLSGGVTGVARAGGAIARLGRTAEEGSALAKLGDVGSAVHSAITGPRDIRFIHPTTVRDATSPTQLPELPIGAYSLSPFRRLMVEKPIDAFFQSRLANTPVIGLPEGTTLNDLRSAYHIRKIANVTRGRTASTAVGEATKATQPFNHAMQALRDESHNDAVASEKFNALVLQRKLGADNMTPPERLAILDRYRENVLGPGRSSVEGVADETAQAKQVRDFYYRLTGSPEFRQFFSEPTEGMNRVRTAWDEALISGLKTMNLDPRDVLAHSLGPAAFVMDKSPEEVLREQPAIVQAQHQFVKSMFDIEKAVKENPGEVSIEEAMVPRIAQELSTVVPFGQRTQVVGLLRDAIDSLKEDTQGTHTRQSLLVNAHATGYLPGNTLAQKVAAGLEHRLGVEPAIAERFAVGGLTNYFPSVSALHMKVRPQGGPIARAMEKLPGRNSGASRLGLHEFRRDNMARTLRAETLGVAPFSTFMRDADLNWFKAGIDRRDPVVFARHIQQRERILAHRMLSAPLIEKLALKDGDGNVLQFKSTEELQTRLGNTAAAQRWQLLPPKALVSLIQSENSGALDVVRALESAGGQMTPEISDLIDRIIDESALSYVRQLGDDVLATKDGQIAVPSAYVKNLINHAKVIDSARGPGRLWQGFINRWRSAVLAYMPSWVLRTSVGHGIILFIGGVWNPVHFLQARQYFGEGFKIPGTDVHLSRGRERPVPPGLEQGSPHEDFGQFGSHRVELGRMAQLTTHTVHGVMNWQRRAAFLTFLRKSVGTAQYDELGEAMQIPRGFAHYENIDKVIANRPDLVHQALNELDRVSYTFGQMAPWERRLAKNLLPFWGWYKFVSKFVWSLPLTYPGRSLSLARLGELGNSAQDSLGPMPSWLRASAMFNTHNLAAVHYLSMLGLNPLGDVMNPADGFQGLVRLGQMSPVIQAGLEGAGYNTLTGGLENIDPSSGIVEVNGQYINLATGKAYDSLDQASVGADVSRAVGGLMRAFPEIRIGELAFTGGRSVYPESIPFVNERRIPSTNPPKDVSPAGIALQYLGVAPKTYNLQKYQANLLKDIVRARTQERKAVAKEQAMK